MTPRVVRRPTLALAIVYAALGALEVVLKIADGSAATTIAFFGGTLLGGAAFILCGLYLPVAGTTRRILVMLGAVMGLLASAWTLVVPVLAVVVIVVNARADPQDDEALHRP